MKKYCVIAISCLVCMAASGQQIDMSKADCSKWQKSFVYYKAMELACGYRGEVSEMMGRFSAAGGCQQKLSSEEVQDNSEQVLKEVRKDFMQQGEEAVCTRASKNYYELQEQYKEFLNQ